HRAQQPCEDFTRGVVVLDNENERLARAMSNNVVSGRQPMLRGRERMHGGGRPDAKSSPANPAGRAQRLTDVGKTTSRAFHTLAPGRAHAPTRNIASHKTDHP